MSVRRIVFVPPRSGPKEDSDGFTYPEKFIVNPEEVKNLLGWKEVDKRGIGLRNSGNTCYLNSVLQALTHSSAIANDAISGSHESHCDRKKSSIFCAYCALLSQVKVSLSSRSERAPDAILKHLKLLAKNMRYGRQEDAHEFLRQLLDSCLTAELPSVGLIKGKQAIVPPIVRSTTFIGQIFSGYLQSKITCSSCHNVSRTFDPFMDLSLEIDNCSSLRDCLARFTKEDSLSGANAYRCSKCQKRVVATKQMLVHCPPPLLTIQLKRFNIFKSSSVQKVNRPISFPATLDIKPYLSGATDDTTYSLYAVIVHEGSSMGSGHYVCYAKASNGTWYLFDDSSVRPVTEQRVLSQIGYILMYEKNHIVIDRRETIVTPRIEADTHLVAMNTATPTGTMKPGIAREDLFNVTVINHDEVDESDESDGSEESSSCAADRPSSERLKFNSITKPGRRSCAMSTFCRSLRAVVRAKDRKVLRMLTVLKLATKKKHTPPTQSITPSTDTFSASPGWGTLGVSSWEEPSTEFKRVVAQMKVAEPGARSQHDFEYEQGKTKHNPRPDGVGLPPSLKESFNRAQFGKGKGQFGKGQFGKGKGQFGKGKGGKGKGGKGQFGKGGKGQFGKGGKGQFGKGRFGKGKFGKRDDYD